MPKRGLSNVRYVSLYNLFQGTTASPKAVPLSHFSLINNSYFYGKRLGFDKTVSITETVCDLMEDLRCT